MLDVAVIAVRVVPSIGSESRFVCCAQPSAMGEGFHDYTSDHTSDHGSLIFVLIVNCIAIFMHFV